MSEPNDPNQPYEPQHYPRMLYAAGDQSVVVDDQAAEAAARSRGFSDQPASSEEGDGLEIRTLEELIEIGLRLQRNNLARMDRADLIAGIRERRVAEAERVAAEVEIGLEANEAQTAPAGDERAGVDAVPLNGDDFDQMDKPALRAFIKERDGKNAPGFFDEEKLRHLARNLPAAA